MTVTIHTGQNSHDLLALIRDLQTLDGGPSHRIRRAVHGSGAIVDDDLALAWLTLTTAPTPEFLESLIRQDPKLEDLVGRRASDAALHELYLYLNEVEVIEAQNELGEVQVSAVAEILAVPESDLRPPGKKAPKTEWEAWAVIAGLMSTSEAEGATKAQIQGLIATSGQSAPKETKEG